MCEFPSGYKFPDGTVKLHTDEDVLATVERLGLKETINWQNWVGHEGWRKCFGEPPYGSVEIEASKAMPYAFPILGKMKKMLDAYGSLDVRGCDLKGVKLPETVKGRLDVRGCDLKGVDLSSYIGKIIQ